MYSKFSLHGKVGIIASVGAVATVFAMTSPAHAVQASVKGKIAGTDVHFNGSANIGIFTKQGPVSGKLSTGAPCTGSAQVDGAFRHGTGSLSCKDGRTARFKFTLTSKLPPKGRGSGKTNKGETINFVFGE